uniref:Uncharacterized protein n=1 Tax=Solanum tuberosum TaxID=4113 RepID=M1DNW8_SOLTU
MDRQSTYGPSVSSVDGPVDFLVREFTKLRTKEEKEAPVFPKNDQQVPSSSSLEIERFLREIRHRVQALIIQIMNRSAPDLQFSSVSGESLFFEDD